MIFLVIGLGFYFFNGFILKLQTSLIAKSILYILSLSIGYILLFEIGIMDESFVKK